MHSDKKHSHGLTSRLNVKVTEKSKANAQGVNNMSPKIGRDLPSNWWANGVSNML